MLLGWGTENAVPYWLIQNTWGRDWGEGGFGRIMRGKDIMRIESNGLGRVSLRSSAPKCAGRPKCGVWARTLADCSCMCPPASALTGPLCDVCPADACRNGGVMLDPACTRCTCPYGFMGARCEFSAAFTNRQWAVCEGNRTPLQLDFAFNPDAIHDFEFPTPRRGSFIAFVRPENAGTTLFSGANATCASSSPSPCPSTGTLTATPPTTPGTYVVYIIRQSGAGMFPPSNWYNWRIGNFTVLPADRCAELPQAARDTAPIDAEAAGREHAAARAAARLAAAQPAIDRIRAAWADGFDNRPPSIEPSLVAPVPPELQEDILPTTPGAALWGGTPSLYQICPTYPPFYDTLTASSMRIDTSLNYLSNALGPLGNNMVWRGAADIGKCTSISLPRVLSSGLQPVFFALSASNTPAEIAHSTQGYTIKSILWNSPLPYISEKKQATYVITAGWQYNNAAPMRLDAIHLVDKNGVSVWTIFTQCNCETPPTSPPATPNLRGRSAWQFPRFSTTLQPSRAPYTLQFRRNNSPRAVVGFSAINVVWKRVNDA